MSQTGGVEGMRGDKTARIRGCAIAAAAAVACGAYAQSALACTPVVDRTARAVAPHLQAVGWLAGRGNCPAIRVADSSADGSVIWGVDWNGGLWRSTDDLASWTRTYQLPLTYKRIMNVLQVRSGHVLIHVIDLAGVESILRSTDATADAFSSVPSLVFPVGATIHGSPSWTDAPGGIYVGEYGDRFDLVTLWKSLDDGVTFVPVFQLPGYLSKSPDPVRHIHDVFADPYNTQRIWLTVGDHPGSRIGYSDDGGVTFTWIARVAYPQSRAVGLLFAADAVYWGTDSAEMPTELWRWDRRSGQLKLQMDGLPGPYYDGAQHNGSFAQFSTIPLPTDGGYTDEYAHVITTSRDGKSWDETRLPWRRDPANTGQTAVQQLISHPNSDGRFWVTYSNLVDDKARPATTLEFRLTDTTAPSATARSATAPSPTAASTKSTTLPTGGVTGGQTDNSSSTPTLTLAGLSGKLSKGVFSVSFNATPGTTTGLLYVPRSSAKALHIAKKKPKLVLIGSGKKLTTVAGPAKLKIKLKSKARKHLKHKRKVKAILQLKTVNAAGQSSPVVTKKVTLKR